MSFHAECTSFMGGDRWTGYPEEFAKEVEEPNSWKWQLIDSWRKLDQSWGLELRMSGNPWKEEAALSIIMLGEQQWQPVPGLILSDCHFTHVLFHLTQKDPREKARNQSLSPSCFLGNLSDWGKSKLGRKRNFNFEMRSSDFILNSTLTFQT